LNLRPSARKTWGFDERKARTLTDTADSDPIMPDALEVAAAQDRQIKQTGRPRWPATWSRHGDQRPVRHI
jgi:amidase